MSFTVASYNVLAHAYVQYGLYRRTPKMVLDPLWRMPAVVYQVGSIGADVLCLQEVEMGTFAALKHRLNSLGYVGQHARKRGANRTAAQSFTGKLPLSWSRHESLSMPMERKVRPTPDISL